MQLQNGAQHRTPRLPASPPHLTLLQFPPRAKTNHCSQPVSQAGSRSAGRMPRPGLFYYFESSFPAVAALSAKLRTLPVPAVVFTGPHPLLALCYAPQRAAARALRLTRCNCADLLGQGPPWLPQAMWRRRRQTQLVYVHQTAVLLLLLLLLGMSVATLHCVIYVSPAKFTGARSLVHIPMHHTSYMHLYMTAWNSAEKSDKHEADDGGQVGMMGQEGWGEEWGRTLQHVTRQALLREKAKRSSEMARSSGVLLARRN